MKISFAIRENEKKLKKKNQTLFQAFLFFSLINIHMDVIPSEVIDIDGCEEENKKGEDEKSSNTEY